MAGRLQVRGPLGRAPMTAVLVGLVCLLMAPTRASAQGNTDETLRRAIRLYEDLQVERALALLRDVISPSTPFVVSSAQRVTAYKYLGAAHAELGQSDSATLYFRAAIERDPFVDLDGLEFTAQERRLFTVAKQRTFSVGVRPITRTRFDPRTESMVFEVLSTHGAVLSVDVRNVDGGITPLVQAENDGVRDIQWNGLLVTGHLAPPGRYELIVRGQSELIPSRVDSARLFFTVELDRPELLDTLPALKPSELLPEYYPPSAATVELAKGLGTGLAAIAIPTIVGNSQFAGPARKLAAPVAVFGLAVGIWSFQWRREHSAIAANIAENVERRAARAKRNAEIERDNAQIVANAALIVSPAAGAGP